MRSKLPVPLARTCQALSGSSVALPLLLTALAFGLRVYRLDDQSLWFDEAWTANVVSQNCASILQATAEDIHPPAYFLALHLWTIVLGNSAFALRFFSVLAGAAMVPFAYLFGRKLQGHGVGLAAAAIVTLAPLQVFYAQEARSYALMPVLTLASSYCLLRVCAEQHRPERGIGLSRWLLSYVAISALSLYTHYTAASILVAQQLFLIHRWWRQRRVGVGPFASPVLIFLCCLPWLLYVWSRTDWREATVVVGGDPLAFRFVWLWRNLVAVSFGPTAIPPLAQNATELLQVIQILMLAVLTLGAVQACRAKTESRSESGWLLVWTFVIALVLVTFVAVPGHPRHTMVSTPSYYLLLAFGLGRIGGRVPFSQRRFLQRFPIGAVVLSLLLATSAFFLNNQYHTGQYRKADDFKTIFPAMEWLARPDDAAILTYGPLQLVLDYYWKGWIPDTYLVPSEQDWANLEFRLSDAEARLRSVLGSHTRYWLVEDLGISLDAGEVERWLRDNTYKVSQESYGRTRISLFSVPTQRLAAKDLQVNFGGKLLFHDPESDGTELESGSPLHCVLHWRLLQETRTDFSVSLWLSDSSGFTYASHTSLLSEYAGSTSGWLAGDTVEQHIGLLVPPGTPPGIYKAKLTVYDIGTSLPLSILDQDSMPVGTELLLDEVQVIPSEFNPDGELAPVDHPVHKDLTDTLRILGYNSVPDRAVLGDTILVDLFWEAIDKPIADFNAAVALVDMQGSRVYQHAAEPGNGRYPFSAWNRGEIVIDKRSVLVPVDTHVGQHQLVVALIDPETQEQKAEVCLGPVLVVDRPRRFALPLIEHEVNSTFGGEVKLLGYELTPAVATPGESLQVVLYWQAVGPMDISYTAFVHLIDDRQQIWGQMDSIPGKGTVPTTSWQPGEVVVDSYDVPVAQGAPEGGYRIEVGLYNAANGQRLAAAGGEGDVLGDSVVLDTIVDVLGR